MVVTPNQTKPKQTLLTAWFYLDFLFNCMSIFVLLLNACVNFVSKHLWYNSNYISEYRRSYFSWYLFEGKFDRTTGVWSYSLQCHSPVHTPWRHKDSSSPITQIPLFSRHLSQSAIAFNKSSGRHPASTDLMNVIFCLLTSIDASMNRSPLETNAYI